MIPFIIRCSFINTLGKFCQPVLPSSTRRCQILRVSLNVSILVMIGKKVFRGFRPWPIFVLGGGAGLVDAHTKLELAKCRSCVQNYPIKIETFNILKRKNPFSMLKSHFSFQNNTQMSTVILSMGYKSDAISICPPKNRRSHPYSPWGGLGGFNFIHEKIPCTTQQTVLLPLG